MTLSDWLPLKQPFSPEFQNVEQKTRFLLSPSSLHQQGLFHSPLDCDPLLGSFKKINKKSPTPDFRATRQAGFLFSVYWLVHNRMFTWSLELNWANGTVPKWRLPLSPKCKIAGLNSLWTLESNSHIRVSSCIQDENCILQVMCWFHCRFPKVQDPTKPF